MAENKEKQYVSDNAQLMAEWDFAKNLDISPAELSQGSHKKVWWLCAAGHSYQAQVYHKSSGGGCPFCQGRAVLPGFNDLATVKPELAAEWNFSKNGTLLPSRVTRSSNKKVWWICSHGHEWEATINSRDAGNACPYCSNQKVLSGYNDLATTNPELVEMWDYEKNNGITPLMVTAGSGKKYWWKCSNGHKWKASVHHKKNGHGCPICANQELLVGYNDLATKSPDIAAEWNYSKNKPLTPDRILYRSTKKVWWKCSNGHEWQSTVVNRQQRGCPICSNKQVLKGYNDLATTNPDLASEWHAEKNGTLTPQMVTAGSNKVVWWKCKNGHEWKTQVNARLQGVGCAQCSAHLRTSFPEQALYYYIKKVYPDAINGYREVFRNRRTNMELDIFIPSINTAIEYDGIVWHNSEKSREREKEKYHICKNNQILLIRIRESSDAFLEACDILIYSNYKGNYREFGNTIKELSKHLALPVDVDIARDRGEICKQYLPQVL